ncbi:MAG: hypothetical protein PHR77_15265 [Kiritimatiellae bacterium]|nr:hypothetical protein [Kiritimatiellia bacterium]MDD5523439.1 hypothetical protein [Kiritimatiellia bacterium]
MKRILTLYFSSWWLPALVYTCFLGGFTITVILRWKPLTIVANVLFCIVGLAFLGLIAASIWNLIKRRWSKGIINVILIFACGAATVFAFRFLMFASMFGPSEDGFADNLKIPEGIDISEPDPDASDTMDVSTDKGTDELQDSVRKALAVAGGDVTEFTPEMPSLSKAATDHAQTFREYIEASPDWHVFMEQGNLFASRCWSYGGEPRDELHGYISEFGGDSSFQTRCLLCLDRKPWSRYSVQHLLEGKNPVKPLMTQGNNLHESRVMIECGGVWVEIFEQSGKPERRVTKATVTVLEKEFSDFERNPEAALERARARSRELATRLAGKDSHPFRLLTGMQPGIYGVVYSLNPGEPGSVYLKAFEVTKGTPLSVERLEDKSRTRMTWSIKPSERFGAKAGFTIYEGDWGKPYAARFEVWFKPDSGKPERKLAERIFKIEGWQR